MDLATTGARRESFRCLASPLLQPQALFAGNNQTFSANCRKAMVTKDILGMNVPNIQGSSAVSPYIPKQGTYIREKVEWQAFAVPLLGKRLLPT